MAKDGELPKWYKKGVTRVSELVSFVHPFKWTDGERRYKDWLKSKGVDEDNYLQTAQDMGTYVHEAMEYFILNGKKRQIKKAYSDCRKEIDWWIEWLKQLSPEEIEPEKYVLEKNLRFQWAVDLLYKKDWKWVLSDFKTYWICKKRFNLDNKNTVPTSKRKKVELQMSIYCYALKQQWIEVELIQLLFLHEEWLKIVEMKPLPDEEIEEILKQWEWKEYTF